jgi:eukaryotic-like serine/threonine-protein kinase
MNKYKVCIYYPSMLKYTSLIVVIIITTSFSLITNSYSSTESEASAFLGIGSLIDHNNDFLTYQDTTLGIKINYPASWIHELHFGNIVTFLANVESGSSSDTYPAGLGIKVQHLMSKNISLTQVTSVQIKNLTQNHPEFKLIESTDTKIGGTLAHKIVFSATDSKKHQRQAMQIWTLRGDKAYLITYKAEPAKYSEYLPTIQKMVDSFQFIQ